MKNDRTDLSVLGPNTIRRYLVLDVLLYLRIAIRTKETIVLSRATARPHKNRFYVDITQYHKDHFYQT